MSVKRVRIQREDAVAKLAAVTVQLPGWSCQFEFKAHSSVTKEGKRVSPAFSCSRCDAKVLSWRVAVRKATICACACDAQRAVAESLDLEQRQSLAEDAITAGVCCDAETRQHRKKEKVNILAHLRSERDRFL